MSLYIIFKITQHSFIHIFIHQGAIKRLLIYQKPGLAFCEGNTKLNTEQSLSFENSLSDGGVVETVKLTVYFPKLLSHLTGHEMWAVVICVTSGLWSLVGLWHCSVPLGTATRWWTSILSS